MTKRKRIRRPKQIITHGNAKRPTKFHPYWANQICSHIERGWSLRSYCTNRYDRPSIKTVMEWLKDDANAEFREQYARAREASADADFDHIGHLAEKAAHGQIDPAAAKVAIDARKWMAGKMKPKKYGDKLEVGGGGKDGAIIVQLTEQDMKLA
jgi:hypothetical protein